MTTDLADPSDRRSADEWRAVVEPRLRAVRERIAAAAARSGRAGDVRLIAVTKTHPAAAILAAVAAGVPDIGENLAIELAAKATALEEAVMPTFAGDEARRAAGIVARPRWHFLGKLQSGTVRHVARHADVVQSGEPGGAIRALARRRAGSGTGRAVGVLIEVDMTSGRQGTRPDDVLRFADDVAVMEGLDLRGLMTVPPATPEPEGARPYFARLRELSERLRKAHPDASELSMGMSVDYEVGVEEGATMVRVGTALFGPRPRRK